VHQPMSHNITTWPILINKVVSIKANSYISLYLNKFDFNITFFLSCFQITIN